MTGVQTCALPIFLFQIDPRPYKAVYDNAMASVASAKAKAERYQRLTSQNAIAAQSYDDAHAAYLEAEATAEAARLNLEYTQIRSPVNGKTGAILIQPGNMVTANTGANANMTTANPLVTINEIQPVKISLSLPQSDLPRIQAQLALPGGQLPLVARMQAGGRAARGLDGLDPAPPGLAQAQGHPVAAEQSIRGVVIHEIGRAHV